MVMFHVGFACVNIILPLGCPIGIQGYFPMQEAYDEDGYEARSSNFAAGVAERIIENGLKLINEML